MSSKLGFISALLHCWTSPVIFFPTSSLNKLQSDFCYISDACLSPQASYQQVSQWKNQAAPLYCGTLISSTLLIFKKERFFCELFSSETTGVWESVLKTAEILESVAWIKKIHATTAVHMKWQKGEGKNKISVCVWLVIAAVTALGLSLQIAQNSQKMILTR